MRRTTLVLAISLAGVADADAGDDVVGSTETASLTCKVGKKHVDFSKKVKLDKDLRCTVKILDDSLHPLSTTGVIYVTQERPLRQEPRYVTELDAVFERRVDFRPCVDVQVHASVSDGDHLEWQELHTIKASCGKAKKLKGTMTCTDNRAGLMCVFQPRKVLERGEDLVFVAQVTTGKGFQADLKTERFVHSGYDDEGWVGQVALNAQLDYDPFACTRIVRGEVLDADGQVVWTGKHTTAQECAR